LAQACDTVPRVIARMLPLTQKMAE
jgi:hypothetical protein